MAAPMGMECGDFLEFQDALKKMRTLDDKIIYMLNTSIPTDSFKGQIDASSSCKELFDQVHKDPHVHVAFKIPYTYDFITQLYRQQAEIITMKVFATLHKVKPNTENFMLVKCMNIQLKNNYENREAAIKRCITVSADRVRGLWEQKEKTENSNLLKVLRKEQTKLRILQAELNVEEVLREQTTKVYYERCRPFYKPPDLSV